MAEGYYGRARAYDAGLLDPGEGKLAAALLRNTFAGAEHSQPGARRLARYVRETEKKLDAMNVGEIESGVLLFSDPGEVCA